MKYIIGADEVGRGSLAGALYVGAVLVSEDKPPVAGVADSKKLTVKRRRIVYKALQSDEGIFYHIGIKTANFIDQMGMRRALHDCFQEAIDRCLAQVPLINQVYDQVSPVEIRIDGKPMGLGWNPTRTTYIVKGDETDWVIGAASILAKVERDAYMARMSVQYPVYGWDQNCGYGSKAHRDAIYEHGLTPLHRTVFCRNWVRKPEDGIDLFDLFD